MSTLYVFFEVALCSFASELYSVKMSTLCQYKTDLFQIFTASRQMAQVQHM